MAGDFLDNSILEQIYSLGIFAISGIIISIFFDFFRVLRKSFKTSDLMTYIEDTVFWIITGAFLLFIIFTFNDGKLRLYIFVRIISWYYFIYFNS